VKISQQSHRLVFHCHPLPVRLLNLCSAIAGSLSSVSFLSAQHTRSTAWLQSMVSVNHLREARASMSEALYTPGILGIGSVKMVGISDISVTQSAVQHHHKPRCSVNRQPGGWQCRPAARCSLAECMCSCRRSYVALLTLLPLGAFHQPCGSSSCVKTTTSVPRNSARMPPSPTPSFHAFGTQKRSALMIWLMEIGLAEGRLAKVHLLRTAGCKR
jgi:hypothetical protein